ncbi:MAG: UvrD-helicase domain-containing protein [Bacillota bacterium]
MQFSQKLVQYKEYFDNILKKVDSNVKLDDEQRRAVVTDDDYCLLIAGAGAGKTTTMAAKVKYLVEKQGVSPQDIIVFNPITPMVLAIFYRLTCRI